MTPNRPVVERLVDGPIVSPASHPSIGVNIQGPSLVRVPDWVEARLGRYYLYFADHKGRYIRLAYADRLTGPWAIHVPGSLRLEDTPFPHEPPELSTEQLRIAENLREVSGRPILHSAFYEMSTPHIASPDVHVDTANRRFVMYYHGLEGPGRQVSRAAVSGDGVAFESGTEILGRTYMRVFRHRGMTHALAMPGQFYRSTDPLGGFEEGPRLFNPDMRHAAVMRRGDTLFVFWTQVGDAPERILLSTVDLRGDWLAWTASDPVEVLRPERAWEGADAPLDPSVRSVAYGMVNQLRDPAVYEEGDQVYLLYAVAGESGIAIARVAFPR
ncbi:MAG: hypothetical protein F4029_08280 [Gammaproteobacteria bacterium]|nr:hypothetical protein [Gammaproteobacteria bacterium]MYF29248.1 hypothetical protein [Gammaproteobacteria bacterium]MYK46211.1 hypothetical protein [Gammaproteobacteria bacterium]